MSERNYYCLCDSNCKYPTMTTEQIIAAIQQAAETGLVYNPDAAVVTKVREANSGEAVTFWVGTQAQYNAISTKNPYCHYIITDSTEKSDMNAAIAAAVNTANGAGATAADAIEAAIVSAKNNGNIDDALQVDFYNYTADINKPHVVQSNAKNIPDKFSGGARLVFPVSNFLSIILLVGQENGSDGTIAAAWISSVTRTSSNEAGYYTAGWQRLNSGTTFADPIILQEGVHYGDELPEAGTKGRLFFKKV